MTIELPTMTINFDAVDGDVGEIVEDVPERTGEHTFELAEFLREGEEDETGKILIARAKEYGGETGERDAQMFLVLEWQIPEGWRHFYLVFTGTKRRDRRGRLYVPSLCWSEGKWCFDWRWLEEGWDSSDRIIRLRLNTKGQH